MNKKIFLLSISLLALSMVSVLLAVQTGSAQANTIYVDDDANPGGNGTSWALAFDDLQDALDEVASVGTPCEIWVATGTYWPTEENGGTGDRYRSFQMINNVGIYGGFSGTETVREQRNWESNETVLSGDIGIPGYPLDNCYHVFYHYYQEEGSAINSSAILDGFTITRGNADGDNWERDGGGMFNVQASPCLTNCAFLHNKASDYGGAIYNDSSSSPIIADCVFKNNTTNNIGGGIYNHWSSPDVTGCTFSSNSANWSGGALGNNSSSPTLNDCILSDNIASDGGGGMYNVESSPILTDCVFSYNVANLGGAVHSYNSAPEMTHCTFIINSAHWGGAIFNHYYSSPNLVNCTFASNTAEQGGGGIYNEHHSSSNLIKCTFTENDAGESGGGIRSYQFSSPIIQSCMFSGNTAEQQGGGIYNELSSSPIITNSVIYQNSAYLGGGMYSHSGCLPVVTNCTFWANSGGGGAMYNSYYSSPTVTNSILWNNDYPEIYSTGTSVPIVDFCNVMGGHPGAGNIDQPPMLVNPVNHDFHLQATSPCIDTGTNSAPNLPAEDYEGHLRIINEVADIGADEYIPGGTPTYTLTITMDPVEGGTIALDPPGGMYYQGTVVMLTATPSVQYEFTNWTGDLIGSINPGTVVMDSDKSVTGHFAQIPMPSNIIYVDCLAAAGGDGRSWEQAFRDLQDGLAAASSYQTQYEIWVAAGTYTPGTSRNSAFHMKNNVGIYGGLSGIETELDQRDWETNRTVLSGEIGIPGFKDDDCYHIISNTNTLNESAILDGFIISGGNANQGDPQSTGLGGGVYNDYGASPTIRNCKFIKNYAQYGGGVYNRNKSCPTITNCTFINNMANTGGAMRNYSNSRPTLIDCVFTANGYTYAYDEPDSTPTPSPSPEPILAGEAINNDDSSPMFTNCTFTGNNTAIENNDGSFPRFTDCFFTDNEHGVRNNQNSSAKFTGCNFINNSGNGIYNTDQSNPEFIDCSFIENYKGIENCDYSSPLITDCIFTGNTKGGIYNYYHSSPEITNSVFLGNTSDEGGAIYNDNQSSPTITNCFFGFNSATHGGAMYNQTGCVPVITNCTFWNNSGNSIYSTNYCIPVVTNSILWGSAPQEFMNVDNSSTDVSYSNIQGGYPGIGNIYQMPQLANPGSGDFHLLVTSPCINAGTNYAPDLPDEDFEGDDRILDGTVDMGADECSGIIRQYSLMVNSTVGGEVTAPGEGVFGPYTQGSVVNLVAEASPCYEFTGWTGDTSTIPDVMDPTTTITMNGTCTITAGFQFVRSNLTLSGGSELIVTPYEGTQLQDCSTVLNISGTTTSCCYGFASWIGDTQYLTGATSEAINAVIMPDNDISLTAIPWRMEVALNLYSTAGGSVLPYETGTMITGFPCGETIQIDAIPDTCSQFLNWTGDIQYLESGSNVAVNSVVMPCQHVSLTASFESWDPLAYDINENDCINYGEMVDALMAYLLGDLPYNKMICVLMWYLVG